MSGRFRISGGSSGLPRPGSSMRESRVSNFRASAAATAQHQHQQPAYDFLTGAEHGGRPSSRQSSVQRRSSLESSKENLAPPDAEQYETQRKRIEELKAELATMRYKMENYEQEKEMAALQHDNELRDARRKADEDFKRKQEAEGDKGRAQRQFESMQNEFQELRENAAQEKLSLEKKAREAEDESRLLREQIEDLSAAKEESERLGEKKINDLEALIANLRQNVQELEQHSQAGEMQMQQLQEQLVEKDRAMGDLEADVLRLKAQTGDAETIAVIKRELQDQVHHIRSLEAKTSKQHAELTHLRQIHKAVEVVEEEKRSLQRRLDAAQALEAELSEARMQRQRLEDERLAWTAYLQNASTNDGLMELDTPEAVARALVEERYNSASLVEKLGQMQPQIAERDEMIKSLEADKQSLGEQIEKLKTTSSAPSSVSRALARVERQKNLANKEIEYLRAQIKSFEDEDITFNEGDAEKKQDQRLADLQALVEQYKREVETMHKDLSQLETAPPASSAPSNGPLSLGSKRPHDDGAENNSSQLSEQLGELNRKRRKLADELAKLQKEHQVLLKEHEVTRSRLKAAESASKTRILSLRSNPTSDFEAIKMSTLAALKQENKDLLAQLSTVSRRSQASSSSSNNVAVIPASQLAAARREVEEAQRETASAKKTALRLKEVWGSKSQEFKEAIFSTLGWTVTFIPNGKMRVESLFYPSTSPDGEHENSIVFDGERGTMKVSGGPQSPFARKIADQIQFWVREKGCIPGFLAALTLEFYEEQQQQLALEGGQQ
ncbi:spindle assembly checkpoint component Mad1 [Microdochium trichocladiopsis]|uniref:Spindle assembly checkpoint component MAD1 n=1 Tax=Microdochium trichocladiopsis TaxID=1682393 RepID=A0A9P8Y850_9PEZI|nr:spindle assembly checkpoint component Mad1 [Microdochium trichocladiopsis]KAH7031618.1 spindle assembly checkpoint component Mad1 [Microdochium trichocladiopsis]